MSPFKFYQYLLTTVTDAEVIKFLRMLTFLPLEDISALESSMQQPGYKPNTAQRLLASEVTRFVHGQQGLDQALKATQVWPQCFKIHRTSHIVLLPLCGISKPQSVGVLVLVMPPPCSEVLPLAVQSCKR